jgi:hypothetical protein
MAHKLPYEIIKHILEYIPTIDIRIHFGIIHKLKSPPLSLQHVCWHRSSMIDDEYVCYDLYNEHASINRAAELLSNDMICMSYKNTPAGFYYRWILYRLKKKRNQKLIENKTYYHTGSLTDHYWDYLEYEYTRL